eukprot:TRINITY_DN7876_c0_g1_i3.p1 TRINITY_DN7876_c0_g1~~TRINITY_DN7876_c0_g1_i3.p1  ORF type:complete len:182 (-),score=23.92 TRINITY_DN7876_c0_g1_i3:109-654(-)
MITRWIGTEIVSIPSLSSRIKATSHAIALAIKLLSLQNFAGLIAVFMGLTQFSVSRLKQTWKGINENFREKWNKIESLCSPLNNFKNLRARHDSCSLPVVKAATLFVKDLTFIEDGNLTYHQNDKNFYNLDKIKLMGRLLNSIKLSQQTTYDIFPVPLVSEYLSKGNWLHEEDLENLSKKK